MRITKPFLPLRVETNDLSHKVNVAGRSYTFGADGMIKSVIVEGQELLAEPMKIIMIEDGKESVFDNNYPDNESESFIQSRSDEKAIICGCKQSDRFIINFCTTVKYDGNIDIDMRLMTRGRTVAQIFGLDKFNELLYKLDHLWLEVPLKKEIAAMYHMYDNSDIYLKDGGIIPKGRTTTSGMIPEIDAAVPFKSLLWLGNDAKGLGWFAEKCKNWQPKDENRAIEIIRKEESIVLRIHLLDSHPISWNGDLKRGYTDFKPIEFQFGFIATPVKQFPENPYIHKAFHVDCGIKIKGNYMDFFASENRFDRLVEKGVDTLILHEKWNKSQNWFDLSEYTAKQLSYIVDECHKRGIKVLPYFGYEISTLSPEWTNLKENVVYRYEDGTMLGGWWRVPFQRDHKVCYNSEYADLFIDGIAKLMDTYNIDGVYLDGTAMPRCCYNIEHGCGWYNEKGELKGTYTIKAVRDLFERLYKEVKHRGGHVNVHASGYVNYTALPYIDQLWMGEDLQFELNKGTDKDVNIDYFRAEYSGRNMGVPVEFIAYENRPVWTFEQALSCSILHGILPRPNDIEYPLTLMSKVWKIFDSFPIALSEWMPYWKNGAETTHEKVKVSYYKYTTITGKTQLLAFLVNISSQDIKNVTLKINENVSDIINTETMEATGFTLDINPYGYKILYIS
ncbi:MAG: hypothetical protein E7329_04495 [Clostridiales bacterium]|nr:hypothetical protein [Clostridiales bacterium]